MNKNQFAGMFIGAVLILALTIGVYIATVLPEVQEYNRHLATIAEQAEQCNCSAIMVKVYPDYYPEEMRT